MSKFTLVVSVLLVACASAVRVKDISGRLYEYDEGNPADMLWERGVIPEYEDDPDVYRDTAWFLDRIMMDEVEIVRDTIPPAKIWRFGSGNKQECVDGKKTIPPQCQWTGMVILEEGEEPEELKLSVSAKYCKQAGLDRPAPKVIDCE
ncbi:hypothetical protein OS493_031956 [Desmophyllum pertusum]|uniref:Uncharacterized protein n=1 Tax=Desmophyllum pertusum TaxID=174260 RepID=A0A9W9ZLB9_9CNID|nr:hypothetical protein OS493_031956 [Desmophyllum pertusum]